MLLLIPFAAHTIAVAVEVAEPVVVAETELVLAFVVAVVMIEPILKLTVLLQQFLLSPNFRQQYWLSGAHWSTL